MSCCCDKTLDFCKTGICEGIIDFDILAQTSGIYKLVTSFLGVQITISKNFAVGDDISFPTSLLNENYQYTANIYDPAGNKVLIRKNLIDYDCFKFLTVLEKNINGVASVPAVGAPVSDETVFQFNNLATWTIPWTPQLIALYGYSPIVQAYYEVSPGVFAQANTLRTGSPITEVSVSLGVPRSGYVIIS